MNNLKLNLRNAILVFLTLLLVSSLFFDAYAISAISNDEKIQNTKHKSKDKIDRELEYLNTGISYDYYKNNSKVKLVVKKVNEQKNSSKNDALDKEQEYLSRGTSYKDKRSIPNGQIYLRTDFGFSKLQTNAYNDNFCINKCNNMGYGLGKTYNFGIGWYINNDYRVDLLYNTASLKFNYDQQYNTKIINYKHKVDVSTLMLNLYRYKNISKYFDLYIGGGVGYTRVSSDNGVREYDNNNIKAIFNAKPSNNFSYNLTSGISLKVNTNVELNLGYRFSNYGKIKGFDSFSTSKYQYRRSYNSVKSDSLKGHNFTLGIIYKLLNPL
ncbi:MAG: hypothetical protein K2P53_04495 [Rickettsiales bacterium]|nr:hypothetical protein [Rickettsiales bacterium]